MGGRGPGPAGTIRLLWLDPGFGAAPAAIVQMALPASRYDAESGRAALERVRG